MSQSHWPEGYQISIQDILGGETRGYEMKPPPKTAGELGILAIQSKNYDAALAHLTKALQDASVPRSKTAEEIPELLIARSQAYLGLQSHLDLALEDTERAYHLAVSSPPTSNAASMGPGPGPASNIHIASLAQYRRAVVLGAMKRYADADACCVWSQHLLEGRAKADTSTEDEQSVTQHIDGDGYYTVTPDDLLTTLNDRPMDSPLDDGTSLKLGQPADAPAAWSRAYMWRGFVLREMQKTAPTDPGRKLTVRRVPPKPTTPLNLGDTETEKSVAALPAASGTPLEASTDTAKTDAKSGQVEAETTNAPINVSPQAPAKLRVDMYQTTGNVYLSVFAKRVDEKLLQIKAGPTSIQLSNLPKEVAGPTGTVVLQLGGVIDEAYTFPRVTFYKIELTLNKKTLGEKWDKWGEQVEVADAEGKKDEKKDAGPAPVAVPSTSSTGAASSAAPSRKAQEPAPGPATKKKVAAKSSGLVYPTSSRNGPKDWDKLAADDDNGDDGDDGTGSSVDAFFKQLYANSTPEQQRAMNKSFTESNGTALSTDWSSVGQAKVATQPPEGVEAKSWDALAKK
ncbi:Cochaperone protein [Sporothrix epigloea]|uniref:Cochaperone protein n=1 Tax=Sporothrix epigloea TaxID=1892477 RepID=A0ABP0D5P9_9PEZI